MWVTEERVEEYKGAGYKLAPSSSETVKPKVEENEVKAEVVTKPKTTRKSAKK